MLAYDSANYSLSIAQYQQFILPHGRWSSVFTQALPLLALKMGCSIQFFLKLYSVNFVLLHYTLFLICTLTFKNNKAGIAMMLAMSLGFRWMFYYAISELLTGMAFCVLLYAVISSFNSSDTLKKKILRSLLALFLIYTISYFHQLALLPALFVLIFAGLEGKRFKDKTLIIIFALSIIWSYIRIKFFSVDDYTHGKILSAEIYREQLFHLFDLPSWGYLTAYLLDFAKWMFYLAVVCIAIMAYKRKWLMLLFFVSYSLAYSILVVLTYYKGESGLMIETYLPPLGLYTAFIFILLFSEKEKPKLMLGITLWLLFVSCRNIYVSSEIQLRRTNYIERIIAYGTTLPNKKYILNEKNLPIDFLVVPWALPFETLLYSSLESKDSSVTFAFCSPVNQYGSLAKKTNGIIGPHWAPEWGFHNNEHFYLPATEYLNVNSSQADSAFQPSNYNPSNLKLIPLDKNVTVPYHGSAYAFVRIINTSGKKIHSIPDSAEPVFISYKIYDLQGNIVEQELLRTPLDVDIYTEYVQGVKINSPKDKGDYLLEIDMIRGENNWWHCQARTKLHIPGKSIFRWM